MTTSRRLFFVFLFGWLASLAVASLLVTFGCLVANRTSSLRGPQCLRGKKKKLTAMVSQRLVQMIFQLGSCCLGCGLIGMWHSRDGFEGMTLKAMPDKLLWILSRAVPFGLMCTWQVT
ncbi:unnamed protein product [Effrenium voratum]|nr:unnamed protein product [Effrenium voratum]